MKQAVYKRLAAQVGAMRRSGMTYDAIAAAIHASQDTVRKAARYDGCAAISVVASRLTGDLFERAKALRAEGATFAAVAQKLGVTKNALVGKFDRLGLCQYSAILRNRRGKMPTMVEDNYLTDADHQGCRYIAGDNPRKLEPGLYCCAECVQERDPETGLMRRSSYCSSHWKLCHPVRTTAQAAQWTPKRRAEAALRQKLKFRGLA